jgi:hypothetical protein
MGAARGFVWQLVATLGYCVLFFLVAAVGELSFKESLIPAGIVAAYALSARLYPRPLRYWLATGPWLLILTWLLYAGEGSLDCGGDCDGIALGGVLLPLAGVAFVAVILAGPLVWIWRRLR